jgi:hypothetical protein
MGKGDVWRDESVVLWPVADTRLWCCAAIAQVDPFDANWTNCVVRWVVQG